MEMNPVIIWFLQRWILLAQIALESLNELIYLFHSNSMISNLTFGLVMQGNAFWNKSIRELIYLKVSVGSVSKTNGMFVLNATKTLAK